MRSVWSRGLIPLCLLAGVLLLAACLAPTPIPTPTPTPTPSPTPTPTATPTPAGPQVVRKIDQGVDVPARERRSVVVPVAQGQRVEGSLTVRGGLDVNLYVRDPFGNIITQAERVQGTRGFAFVAATGGNFDFVFDNAHEGTIPKAVDVSITVWSR